MNTHLPAPASPNVFSSYSSLLVGHLSLCIHHPNPLPSSVIHPQFRHTYIAHHAHRSLFFPFCFISNRIFLVIATLYTFPPPWRHPFPVWYSRNPFFFAYNVVSPPVYSTSSHCFHPHLAPLALFMFYSPGSRCSVHKDSEYYDSLYCIPTFSPTKIISYASAVPTSSDSKCRPCA